MAADIGGTNTRFTLYQIDKENTDVKRGLNPGACAPGAKLFEKKYLNQDYPSFVAVLQKFLEDAKATSSAPVTACFAVAGPVFENKVVFTNRSSWSIEGGAIEKQFGIRKVRLINDFLAVGYGLLTLDEQAECICLQVNIIPAAPRSFFFDNTLDSHSISLFATSCYSAASAIRTDPSPVSAQAQVLASVT